MKKLMLAVLLVAVIAMPALAQNTGNGNWEYYNTKYLNHNHRYTDTDTHADLNVPKARDKFAWGVGADLDVPVTKWYTASARGSYDFNNEETRAFFVNKFTFDVFGVNK